MIQRSASPIFGSASSRKGSKNSSLMTQAPWLLSNSKVLVRTISFSRIGTWGRKATPAMAMGALSNESPAVTMNFICGVPVSSQSSGSSMSSSGPRPSPKSCVKWFVSTTSSPGFAFVKSIIASARSAGDSRRWGRSIALGKSQLSAPTWRNGWPVLNLSAYTRAFAPLRNRKRYLRLSTENLGWITPLARNRSPMTPS